MVHNMMAFLAHAAFTGILALPILVILLIESLVLFVVNRKLALAVLPSNLAGIFLLAAWLASHLVPLVSLACLAAAGVAHAFSLRR